MKRTYNFKETNVKPVVARIAHVNKSLNWNLSPYMTPWVRPFWACIILLFYSLLQTL